MRSVIRSISISLAAMLLAGCAPSVFSIKGVPAAPLQPIAQPAPCVAPAPVAHPHLAPIHFDDSRTSNCPREFSACFKPADWKQLLGDLAELKKESGR
jgi:hypothetical protein